MEASVKERKYKDRYEIVTSVDPRTGREKRSARYAGAQMRVSFDN